MSPSQNTTAKWPGILGWGTFAALAGLGSLVLPALLLLPANANPAYGHPLVPWFAKVLANVHFVPMFLCLIVVGTILGLCQPGWWILSCCLTILLILVLNCVNIIHDWTIDPTSHNLFPFEIAMLIALSVPAVIGGMIGALLRRVVQRTKAASP